MDLIIIDGRIRIIINNFVTDITVEQQSARIQASPCQLIQVIQHKIKEIQQRTFWYFTSGEAQFLSQIYEKKLEREILKKRIQKITDEKMDELFLDIIDGKIKKNSEKGDELDIDLSFIAKSNMEKDQQDTRAKIKQISQDFKQFKMRIQSVKRQQHQKSLEREAIQEEIKQSLQKQKKKQYQQKIRTKVQQLQQKERERKQSHQKFKMFLSQFKKQKPRHQLMQQLYKQKYQLPALEESRRKLQQLQQHRKKPTLEQLNQHDRLYLQKKKQQPTKNYVQNQTIDVFKSNFYSKEKQKYQKGDEQQQSSIIDQLQKRKRYSLFVKESKKPKISQKLKQSLEQMLTPPPILQSPDRSKIIEVGKNYLEFMRKLQKQPRSQTPTETPVTQSRYLNYLQELKSKSERGNTISHDWDRQLRNRRTIQKREDVLMKSKQLEQKAMRDQKFVNHYNFGKAEDIIDKKKEIDETLLSSIKAKVALLKNAQNI